MKKTSPGQFKFTARQPYTRKGHRQSSEPIKTQSKYTQPMLSAGKCV